MLFGQLIEYNKIIVFFLERIQNMLQEDYFLFFKKALYDVTASDLQLSFNIF